MSLTFTCLLYGMAPEWLPFAYTAQIAFYLPSRAWIYKRKQFHYFLFEYVIMESERGADEVVCATLSMSLIYYGSGSFLAQRNCLLDVTF
jgi:hypothetical protein